MARHKKHQDEGSAEPGLDISSLIDVCFLLLIYFIVTSTITPRESDLGMTLPTDRFSDTKTPKINPFFIKIEATGVIYTGIGGAQQAMDSDPSVRDLPLLKSQLEIYANAAKAVNDTPLVQIYADENSTQQRVIDVLNTLASPSVDISAVTFTDLIN